MTMSQQAEVKLKWVVDPNGVKTIEEMAAATKDLSDAETDASKKKQDNLKKEAEELKKFTDAIRKAEADKTATLEAEAKRRVEANKKDRAENPIKTPAEVDAAEARQKAQERASKIAAMRAKGYGASGLTVEEEAAQLLGAQKRKADLKAEMLKQGGKSPAGGAGAGEAGLGELLSGSIGKLGGGLGAGLVAGLTLGGVHQFTQGHGAALSNPFMSNAQREAAGYESIPLFGSILKQSNDVRNYFRGHPEAYAGVASRSLESDTALSKNVAGENYARSKGMMFQKRLSEMALGEQPQNEVFQGMNLSLPAADVRTSYARNAITMPSNSQSTVKDQRKYQEDLILLGARERQEEFRIRSIGASERITVLKSWEKRIGEHQNHLAKSFADAQAEYEADLLARPTAADANSPKRLELVANMERLAREGLAAHDQMKDLHGQVEAEKRIERQGYNDSRSYDPNAKGYNLGYLQSQSGLLESRKAESQAQARSIGMAGPGERYMSEAALDVLKHTDFEYAPTELKQMAAALHPKEVGVMAEQFGKTQQGRYTGEGVPQLDGAISAVEENKRLIAEATVNIAQRTASDMAKITVDALNMMMRELRQEYKNSLAQQIVENLLRNSQPK